MYEDNIARGSAALDAHSRHGLGWVFHVDTDNLEQSDWSRCVVGQLTGEFHTGVRELCEAHQVTSGEHLTHTGFAVRCGFELDPTLGETTSIEEYRALTNEWRAHIQELRFQRRALLDDAPTNDTKKEEVNEHE